MAFNELDRKRIDNTVGELCRKRSPGPPTSSRSLDYAINRQDVVIFERRRRRGKVDEMTESGVAKLRFIRKFNLWRLYWQRANLKWVAYGPLAESRQIEKLVSEIDHDPYGAFFG